MTTGALRLSIDSMLFCRASDMFWIVKLPTRL